ncbi:hypothetical protein [Litoreibacter arenae]|uniref:Uncharacterized protein n=1 Tax=Litoreibacter arenae DSM 19593 TaxID=1123360 RepID=S9QKR2_9RHOB|nr:hypothetical protein [Litoreibacter arenae]EPX80168.1 hypothetical protein thalar_01507 [Litoreibacter arenae DSM 19593]
MIGLVKEYWDDYLRFWQLLGAALLRPIDELSYRVRNDRGMRNSVLFLAAALLTNSVLITLVLGQSLTDMSRVVILGINAAFLSLLGFVSFALAWKICRYKGNFRRLMRLGFYFNGIYVTISTFVALLFYGAFKVLSPQLYREYHDGLTNCEDGLGAKIQRLNDLVASDPLVNTLNNVQATVIFVALIAYWIASVRLYFRLFPMGALRGATAFVLALVFWHALLVVDFVFFLAIGQLINGC